MGQYELGVFVNKKFNIQDTVSVSPLDMEALIVLHHIIDTDTTKYISLLGELIRTADDKVEIDAQMVNIDNALIKKDLTASLEASSMIVN